MKKFIEKSEYLCGIGKEGGKIEYYRVGFFRDGLFYFHNGHYNLIGLPYKKHLGSNITVVLKCKLIK